MGRAYISFLRSRSLKFHFWSLFPDYFFNRFLNRNFDAGDSQIEVFAKKVLRKSVFPETVFYEFRNRFLSFLEGLGNSFSGFLCLENKLKIRRIFNEKTNLEPGIWRTGSTQNCGPQNS